MRGSIRRHWVYVQPCCKLHQWHQYHHGWRGDDHSKDYFKQTFAQVGGDQQPKAWKGCREILPAMSKVNGEAFRVYNLKIDTRVRLGV
jgi:hypothetical protein